MRRPAPKTTAAMEMLLDDEEDAFLVDGDQFFVARSRRLCRKRA